MKKQKGNRKQTHKIRKNRRNYADEFVKSEYYRDLVLVNTSSRIDTGDLIRCCFTKESVNKVGYEQTRLQIKLLATVVRLGYCLGCFFDYIARKTHNMPVDDVPYSHKHGDVLNDIDRYDSTLLSIVDKIKVGRNYIDDNEPCGNICPN